MEKEKGTCETKDNITIGVNQMKEQKENKKTNFTSLKKNTLENKILQTTK